VAAPERTGAPVGLRRLTWVWAGGLATTLVACGLASGNGRDIERVWDAASSGAAGPFPGWFYGGPLLVATAVVVVATEVVLLLVARRPAVADTAPADDLALRTVSARRVLRGTQLVLAWTLAGVLFVAGTALRSVGTIEVDGVGRTSVGLVAGGTTLLLLGLAVALAGPPQPRGARCTPPAIRSPHEPAARGRPGVERPGVRADPPAGRRARRGRTAQTR
jgi:hypothetical protein